MKATIITFTSDMLGLKNKIVDALGSNISITFETNGYPIDLWNSCKDKMPEVNQKVWFFTKDNEIIEGFYTGGKCWCEDSTEKTVFYGENVQYWKPFEKPVAPIEC